MKTHEFDCIDGECIVCATEDGAVSITVLELDESQGEIWLQIDAPRGLSIYVDGKPRETWGTPTCTGLPRVWLMFSLVLSGRTKREVFMPAFNEFVEDYIYAQKTYRGKWERRWTSFAFTGRSLWMVCTCLRIQLWGALILAMRMLWSRLF